MLIVVQTVVSIPKCPAASVGGPGRPLLAFHHLWWGQTLPVGAGDEEERLRAGKLYSMALSLSVTEILSASQDSCKYNPRVPVSASLWITPTLRLHQ